jgi:hypothetical protein
MPDLYEEITEFSGGVQSAAAADRIPLNAMPLAINTAFRNIGGGKANVGCRPGLVTLNTAAFASTPATLFMRLYAYDAGSTFSNYLAIVSNNGTLRYKDTDDTITSVLSPPANFRGTASLCFAAGDVLVDGTVMNNRLFLVDSTSELRSLLNQTFKPWGLSPVATVAVAGAATGANSMPDETYDTAITSYDSATGGESAINTFTSTAIGGASRRLKIDITPTATETATYSHWRVYLRRQTTQADLYKVSTFYNAAGAVIVSNGDIPIATTTVYVDMSSAQIAALTTVAPSQTQYGLPPTDIKYVTTYGRRLICASDRNVYWSLIDKPDSFATTAFEPIETGEGDKITGVYPFSAELCVITTTTSTWGIFGNDPATWSIRPIDHSIGNASHLSITEFEGKLAWWSQDAGPVIFDGNTVVTQGLEDLGHEAVSDDLEAARLSYIYGAYEPQGHRVVWSYSTSGNLTRNNQLLPYNTRLRRFEASYWNPMDAAALSLGFLEDGTQRLFLGGYAGQVFYFDKDTKNDGVPSGTTDFTFVATASSDATLTGSGFYTTDSGLPERYVVICNSAGQAVAKGRISSNTATELTLSAAVSGLSVGSTYTVYIGSPDMRLYTKWLDLGVTFNRKRFDRLYLQAQATGDASGALTGTQIDFASDLATMASPFSSSGEVWDTAIWDTSTWSGVGQLKKRLFIGRTGQAIRVSLFHFTPDVDLVIHTVGVLARQQAERYFGE